MKKYLLLIPLISILLCKPDFVSGATYKDDDKRLFNATVLNKDPFNPELSRFEEKEIESEETQNNVHLLRMNNSGNGNNIDVFVPNKSFLSNYYSHLSDNIPRNQLGICGYTAISMFLSFYDTYWNDCVIEEKYDKPEDIDSILFYNPNTVYDSYQSPGVYNNILDTDPDIEDLENEAKLVNSNVNSEEYKKELDRLIMREIMKQINSDTFLGKLFQIAISNGSIKPHFVMEEYKVANQGYLNGIGVGNKIMNDVLGDYVKQNDLLNRSVTIRTSKIRSGLFIDYNKEKKRVRDEIINILKDGKPVIVGGQGYSDKNNNGKADKDEKWGHLVVAYEYDELNDIIYANMGWGSGSTHANLNDLLKVELSDYWSFDFNSEFTAQYTNNYYFTNLNATYSPFQNVTFNTLSPSEYGFPESYGGLTNSINSFIYLPSSRYHNFVQTKRMRTGFIEGECINLSPKKTGAGTAYLEYVFPKEISKISVDLSFWSAKENVYSFDSEYKIEYYIDGTTNPVCAVNLWTDVSLPKDRTHPLNVSVSFPSSVRKFRFYASSTGNSDRNKGRLSVFDMTIYY